MSLPIMLNVEGRVCLVVGGGLVGIRKARTFQEAGASVTLLSSSLRGELPEGVTFIQARYSLAYLQTLQPWLVVTATNSDATNDQIHSDARQAKILVMRADNPGVADIQGVMSREQGDIQVSVTSGSPLLSRLLLDRFEAQITPAMITLAAWLKALRPASKIHIADQNDRAALWRKVFESDVLAQLEAGDESGAKQTLIDIVGEDIAKELPA